MDGFSYMILWVIVLGIILIFGILIDWWAYKYHNEKFCWSCGCEITMKWYYTKKEFDTKTGVGKSYEYLQAECSKSKSHFSRETKHKRVVLIQSENCENIDPRKRGE